MKLKPIMFAGTGSDVGKSVITAAFCRIFKQAARSVIAPYNIMKGLFPEQSDK
jgi:cobyric acid synthase